MKEICERGGDEERRGEISDLAVWREEVGGYHLVRLERIGRRFDASRTQQIKEREERRV